MSCNRNARAVLTAGFLLALVGPSSSASAQAERSIFASGEAHGIRVGFAMPNFVVVSQFLDAGGPMARSLANSASEAKAFASLPYPGDNVVALPGTLGFASGHSIPASYPLYTGADYPVTPSQKVSDPSGSFALAAEAQNGRASGTASFQPVASESLSRAWTETVLDVEGTTRVVAESVDHAISVGDGTLRIGSIVSRSESTLAPGGDVPVRKTSLLIEGASVGGQAVTIDGSGIHAAGSEAPLPLGESTGGFDEVLKQAGVSVRVLPAPRPDPEGTAATSDVVEIASTQTVPGTGDARGTLVWTFGGATTEILVGSDAPAPAEEPTAAPSTTEGQASPSRHPTAAPVTSGAAPSPPPPLQAAAPATPPSPVLSMQPASAVRDPEGGRGSAEGVYAVLAVGGLALLTCTRLRRRGGRR